MATVKIITGVGENGKKWGHPYTVGGNRNYPGTLERIRKFLK